MIARRSRGPVAARPAAASSVAPSRPMLDDAAFETTRAIGFLCLQARKR